MENIQYVTDLDGKRLAVILPLEEYENILVELGMTAADYESSEPSRPLNDVVAELLAAGEIDV